MGGFDRLVTFKGGTLGVGGHKDGGLLKCLGKQRVPKNLWGGVGDNTRRGDFWEETFPLVV